MPKEKCGGGGEKKQLISSLSSVDALCLGDVGEVGAVMVVLVEAVVLGIHA